MRGRNKVQLDTLRSLLGVVAHQSHKANIVVLVAPSTFTRGAQELILSECRLDGRDYHGITRLGCGSHCAHVRRISAAEV